MKITIQIVLENTEQGQDREDPIVEEIFSFERTEDGDKLAPESLGLTLDEAKSLLAGVQKKLVTERVGSSLFPGKTKLSTVSTRFMHRKRAGIRFSFSTLFGKLKLDSPRFYTCECQREIEMPLDKTRKMPSFSPFWPGC